jgi:hypothetical protein
VAATVAAHHTEPGNFGTLHLVTGTRAARALIAFLDGPAASDLALRTAQAAAAALVGLGQITPGHNTGHTDTGTADTGTADTDSTNSSATPHTAGREDDEGRAYWATISRLAIESGDPHVAKLVYACLLEEQATGRPIHRELAARQVGLSSPSST